MSIPITPVGNRLIVERDPIKEVTDGGLILSDSAKEESRFGTVLAVGPGYLDDNGVRVPLQVSPGDRILFNKHGGTTIEHGGRRYLVVCEDDIYATVED